jgi:transposase
VTEQAAFREGKLEPVLEDAKAGKGHVFFVDAAHCVYGSFLCCLWSFVRLFVRAAAGRQRFNILGAWDALARELVAVTNTTVVNALTMCDLLEKIARRGLAGPVTLVLDNARYQKCALVKETAAKLGITLLYLPSYSPNLNLIERLWKFIKREALYGRWHPTFADFKTAIEKTVAELPGKHKEKLASLMTLKFQVFDDVSLLAA